MKKLSIIGHHNAGKTTVILKLVQALKNKYKIGYLKNDPKGHATYEKEGSDTQKVFNILGESSLISKGNFVFYKKSSLKNIFEFYKEKDLLIMEGFKFEKDIQKVLVGELKESELVENIVFVYEDNFEDFLNFIESFIKEEK